MPIYELLDVLVFIVKGSRIIDRSETNWGEALLLPRGYVESRFVYTKAEAKDGLGSMFDKWLRHPDRWTQPTVEAAIQFCDEAARGLRDEVTERHENAVLERRIDDLVRQNANLRARLVTTFPNGIDAEGVLFVQDEPRFSSRVLSQNERYRQAIEKRDELSKRLAELPAGRAECVQLELDVSGEPDSVPPWQTPHS